MDIYSNWGTFQGKLKRACEDFHKPVWFGFRREDLGAFKGITHYRGVPDIPFLILSIRSPIDIVAPTLSAGITGQFFISPKINKTSDYTV